MVRNDSYGYFSYDGNFFMTADECYEYERANLFIDFIKDIKFFDKHLHLCTQLDDIEQDAMYCYIVNSARTIEMLTVIRSWDNEFDAVTNKFSPLLSFKNIQDDTVLMYSEENKCWVRRQDYAAIYNWLSKAYMIGK